MFLLCHRWLTTTNLSYSFLFFETSATALCGTTGRSTTCCNHAIYVFPHNILFHLQFHIQMFFDEFPPRPWKPSYIPNCSSWGWRMHLVRHLAAESPDEKQAKKRQKWILQVPTYGKFVNKYIYICKYESYVCLYSMKIYIYDYAYMVAPPKIYLSHF